MLIANYKQASFPQTVSQKCHFEPSNHSRQINPYETVYREDDFENYNSISQQIKRNLTSYFFKFSIFLFDLFFKKKIYQQNLKIKKKLTKNRLIR